MRGCKCVPIQFSKNSSHRYAVFFTGRAATATASDVVSKSYCTRMTGEDFPRLRQLTSNGDGFSVLIVLVLIIVVTIIIIVVVRVIVTITIVVAVIIRRSSSGSGRPTST